MDVMTFCAVAFVADSAADHKFGPMAWPHCRGWAGFTFADIKKQIYGY